MENTTVLFWLYEAKEQGSLMHEAKNEKYICLSESRVGKLLKKT